MKKKNEDIYDFVGLKSSNSNLLKEKKERTMLPVRCYTCNKVLGHLEKVLTHYRETHPHETLFSFYQKYRIERYCCQRILLTYVPNKNETFDVERHYPDSVEIIEPSSSTTMTTHRMFIAR